MPARDETLTVHTSEQIPIAGPKAWVSTCFLVYSSPRWMLTRHADTAFLEGPSFIF